MHQSRLWDYSFTKKTDQSFTLLTDPSYFPCVVSS